MNRARTLVSCLVGFGLAASLLFTGPQAHSTPDKVKDAQKRVNALHEESSKIDLEYSKLTEKLTSANASVKNLDKDVAAQRGKVTSLKASMGKVALTQYQNSGLGLTAKLLGGNTDSDMLKQLTVVQKFNDQTNLKLQNLQAEQGKLQQLEATVTAKRDQIAADHAKQKALSVEYKNKLDEAEKVLKRLTDEERARLKKLQEEEAKRQLEEARKRDQEAAQNQQSQDEDAPSTTPTNSTPSSNPAKKTPAKKAPADESEDAPAVSGGAAAAVAYAKAQVGKGYVMGTSGPSTFDCSGLTSAAWRRAGVSLPRTSQGQASAGVRVSVSNIKPGDIVIFYSGASHVGIYVGGGMIVDAANPRAGVRMISLHSSWMPIHSVRRVG